MKTSVTVEHIVSFGNILNKKFKLTKVQMRLETIVKLIDVKIFSNPSFG